MSFLRSLAFSAIFYPATCVWVLVGLGATLFGRRPTLAVVLSWVELHHWLAKHVLGISARVEGVIPQGPHLIAVKHQSMFETLEMVRLCNLPVIVMKKELADIPLFGLMTRRYGVIAVERSAGAKALYPSEIPFLLPDDSPLPAKPQKDQTPPAPQPNLLLPEVAAETAVPSTAGPLPCSAISHAADDRASRTTSKTLPESRVGRGAGQPVRYP